MNLAVLKAELAMPTDKESALAAETGRQIAAVINNTQTVRAHFGPKGAATVELPVAAVRLLLGILEQMARGNAVTLPAVYEALKLDTHIDEIARQASLFKNLQDRFRQAATVAALGPYDEFQATFDSLMERMEATRSASITPPERCFKAAQKKIGAGHYQFDSDGNAGAGSDT